MCIMLQSLQSAFACIDHVAALLCLHIALSMHLFACCARCPQVRRHRAEAGRAAPAPQVSFAASNHSRANDEQPPPPVKYLGSTKRSAAAHQPTVRAPRRPCIREATRGPPVRHWCHPAAHAAQRGPQLPCRCRPVAHAATRGTPAASCWPGSPSCPWRWPPSTAG